MLKSPFRKFLQTVFHGYFCIFALCIFMMIKPSESKLDWKDCFGQSRQYTLFMLKSQQEPMRFASTLSKLFGREFSFITDYAPDRSQPQIQFPTYFAVLDAPKDINMVVMANRTTLPQPEDVQPKNPLLGLSMFEENIVYFFFNDRKEMLFKCPYHNYDYIVILYSDKDSSITEISELLELDQRFQTVNVTHFLQKEPQKTGEGKRISTLQNLIEYFGVLMNNILEERIRVRMRGKEIPMSNHAHRRFQIDQVITSPLLYREDI